MEKLTGEYEGVKNYILDTTVLLYDAQALFNFRKNNVIIPITVIEDIDHFKKEVSEIGRSARQTSRILDTLRNRANLSTGVKLENGGMLFVKTGAGSTFRKLPDELRERSRDNLILAIALQVKEQSDKPAIFVSKDINLRIKADALGLDAEDYESDKVDIEELYPGFKNIEVSGNTISRFVENGFCSLEEKLLPNQYVSLISQQDSQLSYPGRFDALEEKVVSVSPENREGGWRITPRNREQAFAMDALLNDEIQLVTLVGKAGTGKTLLAVAASLFKTVDENIYSRILVSRPTLPLGKDIGYLPGTVEEKLTPWMYPIVDNVELLMRKDSKSSRQSRGFRELVEMGILIVEPLTYIRGRSIHNQYLIIDEAQNLTPHEIKTIITRVGEGTKIVVTGDPYQIDNPYIDSSSNGLSYVVEKFKKQDVAAHVTLTRGERSRLSELAANLL
ncbi:PhoH family protein [Chitinispirillales bacterium ANBcel5]|uniref:PhoH family protein n=1 Tax=Cellulosispirillum alkaliphilum TaxID=3039283 RepID=UPI002A54FA9F|nr:PhoH family protein [Chitinispirillales bacterium ANBcel5]